MSLRNLNELGHQGEVHPNKNVECNLPTESDKRKLKSSINSASGKDYKMNSGETINHMGKRMDPDSQKFFTKALYSGDDPKVRLIGAGKEYYKTGKDASGNFLTKEHPGKTPAERKENLQLPPGNDAKDVSKVKSARPQVVIESRVNPQPDWAKEAGYKARPGMKQIYTPNINKEGAIKDGRYNVIDHKKE